MAPVAPDASVDPKVRDAEENRYVWNLSIIPIGKLTQLLEILSLWNRTLLLKLADPRAQRIELLRAPSAQFHPFGRPLTKAGKEAREPLTSGVHDVLLKKEPVLVKLSGDLGPLVGSAFRKSTRAI